MAETPDSQAAPAPDNTHWGVAYLREDLQDLRQQLREDVKDLRQQIAETHKRIDETNKRIDETNKRIDETNKRIDETNKLIESRFAWLITTMVALTGILIAVIKL
ncbi:MAG: peptidoglycan bridge formation glycyltransferase FemA/FemB family protein [Candidatus Latescibacteria bacterium]|nr:peptidoglycan bridge formation glycyltransferase FemA/FemB family protein [Candidatus Latescibacterota bacterium]